MGGYNENFLPIDLLMTHPNVNLSSVIWVCDYDLGVDLVLNKNI